MPDKATVIDKAASRDTVNEGRDCKASANRVCIHAAARTAWFKRKHCINVNDGRKTDHIK